MPQVEILEGDIDRLYDDWFAETCEEWVVPYIGDLLGFQLFLAGLLLLIVVLFVTAGLVGWLRNRFPVLRSYVP